MWEGQIKPPAQVACHKAIRKVAQEAAGQLYETLMADNVVFEEWKKQNPGLSEKALETRFITKNWGRCIEFARATLGSLLGRPDISDEVKREIHEVLVLDAQLRVGRVAPGRATQIVGATIPPPTIH